MPSKARVSIKASTAKLPGLTSPTTGYYFAFIALGLVTASLGPTLPDLAEHTQSQLSEISYLFTARSSGYLIGSFQSGRLYDRLPGNPVAGFAMITMATMMVLVPMLPLLWVLLMAMLVLGLAEGALDVGGNTLLVWVHRHRVGPFMNALHFFFGVGAFLSPIIISQAVLISGDINWAYWTLALFILPVGAWLFRLPSPAAPAQSENQQGAKANHRLIAWIVVFLFLYVGAEVSYGGWIFTYTVRKGLSGERVAALLTAAFWGALTLGRLLTIPAAARVKPNTVLWSSLFGCLISVGAILLWPASLAAAWLGTLGIGASMAAIFPTTLSLAQRHMAISGQTTGWFFVGASSGGMFLPWLIGQFIETGGPLVAMIVIMTDMLVATAVMLAFIRITARAQARRP